MEQIGVTVKSSWNALGETMASRFGAFRDATEDYDISDLEYARRYPIRSTFWF